jgi:hypothetical protein
VPDWDENSDKLQENLRNAYRLARDSAKKRATPSVEEARKWHEVILQDLTVPDEKFVDRFRGEVGLLGVEVFVRNHQGTPSADVAFELEIFAQKLTTVILGLDSMIPKGQPPQSADAINAVIELCAWAHAEWVRIHPFANGNGRTARLWAGFVAMRYGLPPFVRLRPRPDGSYVAACGKAMEGDWMPTAAVFRRMYLEAVRAP